MSCFLVAAAFNVCAHPQCSTSPSCWRRTLPRLSLSRRAPSSGCRSALAGPLFVCVFHGTSFRSSPPPALLRMTSQTGVPLDTEARSPCSLRGLVAFSHFLVLRWQLSFLRLLCPVSFERGLGVSASLPVLSSLSGISPRPSRVWFNGSCLRHDPRARTCAEKGKMVHSL